MLRTGARAAYHVYQANHHPGLQKVWNRNPAKRHIVVVVHVLT
jgi:hypothetical protein